MNVGSSYKLICATIKVMTKGIIAVVLSLALVLAVFLGGSILLRNARASVAQNRGEAFVAKLYAEYQIMGKSCQGEDTDGDAYVSCDFRLKNPTDAERVVHLQCPTMWKAFLGNTCKESRLVLPQ